MNAYLIAAFVLLLAMLFLVLRPWLFATEPVADGAVDLSDPAAKARSVARVERISRPAASAATTAAVIAVDDAEVPAVALRAEAPVAPPVMGSTSDDVRASVEAAIAARKAALKAKHCTACEAVLGDGDAFCRSCGTKVTA